MADDKIILDKLIDKLNVAPEEASFNDDGRLIKLELNIPEQQTLPDEIWKFTSLEELLIGDRFHFLDNRNQLRCISPRN